MLLIGSYVQTNRANMYRDAMRAKKAITVRVHQTMSVEYIRNGGGGGPAV